MPKRSSKNLKKKISSENYEHEILLNQNSNAQRVGYWNDESLEEGVKENNSLNIPNANKEKIERKKSIWAPAATATIFADVPVFTICPYCNQKVVTKTQFRRGRKNW